ncbi:hypothetical protein [Pseudoneobacillus sp. C159]
MIKPGDKFELPDFNKSLNTIAFCESPETFLQWQDSKKTYELAELVFLNKEDPFIMVPKKFATVTGEVIYEPAWGAGKCGNVSELDSVLACWVLLKGVPIISSWQASMTEYSGKFMIRKSSPLFGDFFIFKVRYGLEMVSFS